MSASPGHQPSASLSVADYLVTHVALAEAQELFRFSKSGFFRFRQQHDICCHTGRRVSLRDIVDGFEAERSGMSRRSFKRTGQPLGLEEIREYAAKLLSTSEIEQKLGYSSVTFWRLRLRRGIRRLSFCRFHVDDVLSALVAEGSSPSSLSC